jgi:hypothetical protein
MSNWLIAIGVVLLIGGVATLYFRTVQLRTDEARAGIAALSGVSWRSFIHMVFDALARRGFQRVAGADVSGDGEHLLEGEGGQWLLSCKHGSAFVLGRLSVNELARAVELRGASGGFLVTQGRITDDARPLAESLRIELLDGQALWPQLRDFLPEAQLDAIRTKAGAAARRRIVLSWLAAVLAGTAIWLALPQGGGTTPSRAPAPAAPPAPQDPVAAAPAATSAPPPVAPAPATVQAPPTPEEVARQRVELADAVSALPGVDRAVWSSESTLQVYASEVQADPFAAICPVVERYDELASSRIQFTPPPGTTAMVRFRQCRPY